MVRTKTGVSLDNTHQRIFLAIAIAAKLWEAHGVDLVITGANETGHHTNPDPTKQFHRLPDGSCKAVDLRSWNLPPTLRSQMLTDLRKALGPGYDVLYERPGEQGEHYHIEWDPKEGTR